MPMRSLTSTPFVAVAVTLLATLLLAFSSVDQTALEACSAPATHQSVAKATPAFSTERVAADVLWLARAIYSETKRSHEQTLVAWTIRNRVETNYRGKDSYESVVLDPWQYSAFNTNSPKRHYYTTLAATSTARGFETALRVAYEVYYADASERPFDQTTRHFYSERSMTDGTAPTWAVGQQPVELADIDPRRFRFYAAIA